MEKLELLYAMPTWLWLIFAILIIWDTVWKIVAMWRSARNNQLIWFVCITIFNTIGILPIVYLLTHTKSESSKS